MEIIVGNKITVNNPEPSLVCWCERELVMSNPDYDKKVRMGKWTGGTPENIVLYERNGKQLRLPFGCLGYLERRYGSEAIFKGVLRLPQLFWYDSHISLYPYQEKAVQEALRAKNGIIVMPCGAGKTQTALEIIARLGMKALWITHTQDLLKQSLNRAKAVFGAGSQSYGTITAGKVDIGEGLTFATVQTLSKINLDEYKDTWGVVVVDECHKAVGSPTKIMQFYKVVSALACRYKFGITATPKRPDGLEKSMFALLGGIVHEVPRDEVAGTTCPVKVKFVETGYSPSLEGATNADGTLNYAGLINEMTEDVDRMSLVGSYCVAAGHGPTLVLANRVQYLENLSTRLKKSGLRCLCLSTLGTSAKAKKVREDALNKLNSGELDCILATYMLAKEGLDVPNLKYLILATPEKDETTVTQAVGRVGRKAPGKKFGTVIDFVDSFGMLKGWANKRRKIYDKLDYIY